VGTLPVRLWAKLEDRPVGERVRQPRAGSRREVELAALHADEEGGPSSRD